MFNEAKELKEKEMQEIDNKMSVLNETRQKITSNTNYYLS
jgi:hypothetical protein